MKISIITPSVRKNGLEIVRKAIKSQSFIEWEWLIGSKFDPEIPEATWVKDDFEGGFWSLNRIYNKLIRQAQGELIVSLQDWVWCPPDTLQKFWDNYQTTKSIISGVGDQYEKVGKFGKPEVKIWTDPRKTDKYGSFYEINPCDNEWNFCATPRKSIFDIGGFDEGLDFLGFGMDGYQVNERLDFFGYKFFIDQQNESFTVRHDRSDFGGQENWDKHNNLLNGNYEKRRQELMRQNKWPVLDHLLER